MRVPLVIHFPGGEYGGQRIRTPVSLVDVMPTLFDYLGRSELCADCRGRSLLSLMQGEDDSTPSEPTVYGLRINQTDYYRPQHESRGEVNVVIRQGDRKGIWNAELETLELYDLGDDPAEKLDLSGQLPALSRDCHSCEAPERLPHEFAGIQELNTSN